MYDLEAALDCDVVFYQRYLELIIDDSHGMIPFPCIFDFAGEEVSSEFPN